MTQPHLYYPNDWLLPPEPCLRSCFATFWIPEQLVSENGPRVTSDEFQQFVGTNGNKHTLVPAYHPSSNGAAERSVPILKRSLKKQVFEGLTFCSPTVALLIELLGGHQLSCF